MNKTNKAVEEAYSRLK